MNRLPVRQYPSNKADALPVRQIIKPISIAPRIFI